MMTFQNFLDCIAEFEITDLSKVELLELQSILTYKLANVNHGLNTMAHISRHSKKTED